MYLPDEFPFTELHVAMNDLIREHSWQLEGIGNSTRVPILRNGSENLLQNVTEIVRNITDIMKLYCRYYDTFQWEEKSTSKNFCFAS